jgi:TPR repeat protein
VVKKIFQIFFITLALTTTAYTQVSNFQKGLSAFNSKDFEQALEYMKPYADDSSNCLAQYVVGFCYADSNTSLSNDSLSEHYLLLASENRYGRAMGLLSTKYFMKGLSDTNALIKALVWAELAANYDPAQSLTSVRFQIRKLITPKDLKKAEKLIKEKKKILDEMEECM